MLKYQILGYIQSIRRYTINKGMLIDETIRFNSSKSSLELLDDVILEREIASF